MRCYDRAVGCCHGVKLQKTLVVYFFCFAKSKLADLFGSLEESSSRFASQLDPLWPPEDAGRG